MEGGVLQVERHKRTKQAVLAGFKFNVAASTGGQVNSTPAFPFQGLRGHTHAPPPD